MNSVTHSDDLEAEIAAVLSRFVSARPSMRRVVWREYTEIRALRDPVEVQATDMARLESVRARRR